MTTAARRWTRGTRIGLAVWLVVVLLQVAAVGAAYALWTRPYVTTVNAQVDGDQVQINAPAEGILITWSVRPGSDVAPGQAVGRIQLVGTGFAAPQQIVRSPGRGRIALDMAVPGQWVTSGTTLALAYGSGGVYVTARVPTDVIAEVREGAPVDLAVDAYPHATVTGVVSEIQSSTAGSFDIYPSPDQNTNNPQRVKQWVPVKITFTDTGGAAMLPGLNVTARIRRT